MNKLDRYLDNLKEPALRQVIRFLLVGKTMEEMAKNIVFVQKQVDEFNKMYPKGGE